MKKILIFIITLIIPLSLLYSAEMEQTLVVQSKSGTENEQLLSEVQKITFNASSMTIISKDGQSIPFSLSDIQKILFSQKEIINANNDVNNDADNLILLYPNPVQDVLYVDGVEENTIIRIFNIQGALCQSTIAKEKIVQLNVNAITQGM